MLDMRQVTKVYRTELVETHALRSLDLHVKEGEFVAVTGPSGSGKTTFLNIAGLLETFTGGEFTLDGENVKGLSDNQRSKLRNQKIGFIFQSFNLIPDLNLFDNCDVPLRYRGMPANERKLRIEDALGLVGLGSRMKHFPAAWDVAAEPVIVCGEEHRFATGEQVRESGVTARIVVEPARRDTAPALTLAALYQKGSGEEQRAWRELLATYAEQLREWAVNYPPTFGDKHLLGHNFKATLAELEKIVGQLESGQAPLEQSIELYERGAALKAHCETRLEAARLRVEKIVVGPQGPTGVEPAEFA